MRRGCGLVPGLCLEVMMLPLTVCMLLAKRLFARDFDDMWPCNASRGQSYREPVLFVHGYGGNESMWLAGRWFLRRRFDLFSVQVPDGAQCGMADELAVAVRDKVLAVLAATGHARVWLVGHGLGGLVAAAVALQDPGMVKGVVTLASPWQGVPLVTRVHAKREAETSPGSFFLTRLNAVPLPLPLLCVVATCDICVPPDMASPKWTSWQTVITRVCAGHASVALVPHTWRAVQTFLLESR